MTIYERLQYLAAGGRIAYLHKNGKENKQTTKLQNLLSKVCINQASIQEEK